ncbi:hypothetical protein F0U60_32245 [Archangium minus]|uniref:Lipoprotein n=1 Tax=Archangium minus TaxID=83450 RepID=A0ABY9WYR5_9BACT|nr:hypothetical protein F0U61_32275 [Archangium violaceum]WNG48280.1 hypothetical protein F0U60_32245 [Archangium minus]
MSNLLRSLLAATAFLSLAPHVASARPPNCDVVCDESSHCSDTCWFGHTMTCGEWGFCGSTLTEPSDETASVAQDDASSQVCSEEQQSAELSASVES